MSSIAISSFILTTYRFRDEKFILIQKYTIPLVVLIYCFVIFEHGLKEAIPRVYTYIHTYINDKIRIRIMINRWKINKSIKAYIIELVVLVRSNCRPYIFHSRAVPERKTLLRGSLTSRSGFFIFTAFVNCTRSVFKFSRKSFTTEIATRINGVAQRYFQKNRYFDIFVIAFR